MPNDPAAAGPQVNRCLHPGCQELPSFGFSRMSNGKCGETVWACRDHREEGREWWRQANGG